MREYVIVTDSSCDLPAQKAAELCVTVVPLEVNLEDAGTKMNDEIDIKEFYEFLRSKKSAKTSAVNMDRFAECFEQFLKEGKDVLYIGFSSGLSATYMAAKNAAEDLAEKYPEAKIVTVDSLCASLGQGLLVYHAVCRKNMGEDINEVAKFIEDSKLNLCHWFTVDDLFFLKRGGRVSGATAVLGTMLSIKPVMHVDDEGHLINVQKARGRVAAITALFDKMRETAIDPQNQVIYISHGDCYDDAKKLADMIEDEFGIKDILISEVGPVIGAHSGPGTLALFFLGSKR